VGAVASSRYLSPKSLRPALQETAPTYFFLKRKFNVTLTLEACPGCCFPTGTYRFGIFLGAAGFTFPSW
jgi:hypothetical protein